ncbi:hypothetical protein H072_2410 [Dactylellina haptotyla CBS 200.50]|uniref:Uncharacterized protein n=1 Tax=Dactylellina haptotyla (strain CBS 200.50) TaxID=1284197 RepID=S8AL23_DACHA|nr:hypothetical protein H072_2410 [Dactylellina haptotyla CBS 200.50]
MARSKKLKEIQKQKREAIKEASKALSCAIAQTASPQGDPKPDEPYETDTQDHKPAATPPMATRDTKHAATTGENEKPVTSVASRNAAAETDPTKSTETATNNEVETGSDSEIEMLPIIINRDLFDMITDISIFARWKKSKFCALDNNSLRAFIYTWAREELPTFDESRINLIDVFIVHVYQKQFWPAWVRQAIFFCIREPHNENLKWQDVSELRKAADDLEFLALLAPHFKAKAEAAFHRDFLHRFPYIKTWDEEIDGPILIDPTLEDGEIFEPDLKQEVAVSAAEKKKGKKRKKVGQSTEIGETKTAAARRGAFSATRYIGGWSNVFPDDLPHIRKIKNFDDLMDLFIMGNIEPSWFSN